MNILIEIVIANLSKNGHYGQDGKGLLPSAKLKPTFTFLVSDFAIFIEYYSILLLGKIPT